jgi:tRNA threonylcarbamoyladenosine biosynthesis protein TsaE
MFSQSEEQTLDIATTFARSLHGGEVIFLEGDLGTGKTTFVRGIARALGFNDLVRSPTFTIVNRYPVDYQEIKMILHLDLYRITNPREMDVLALEEEIGLPTVVTCVEWPAFFLEQGVKPRYHILFECHRDKYHIEINKNTTA